MWNRLFILLFILVSTSSGAQIMEKQTRENPDIVVGAAQTHLYLDLLSDKNVGVVANQTSVIGDVHLVDSLLSLGVSVKRVFAPEHGFRGDHEAGASVANGIDVKTGIPIVSLYGSNKKPTEKQLEGLDILVFDIQDVGARFYTYLSTLHYVMEAAAENDLPTIVLDRPNPNGFYVDGPVLEEGYKSFVGMHPIPVVHGMTLGELAMMINGEGWLTNDVECDLQVITCDKYTHLDLYELPIKPSPNLPNMSSIYLYPSLCFFEGTIVSVGRGTDLPFQVIGHPDHSIGSYSFTPQSIKGVSENPKHKGKVCNGHNLSNFGTFYFTTGRQLYLDWLIGMYETSSDKSSFFKDGSWFDRLAGTSQLRQQIIDGVSLENIRNSWSKSIIEFKMKRSEYLLYPDFE